MSIKINEHFMCATCLKMIDYKTTTMLLRCTDTYVCSKKCAVDRIKYIRKIDPKLNFPCFWPTYNKTGQKITKSKSANDLKDAS